MKVMTATLYRDDLLYVPGYNGAELRLPANADEIQDAMERARIDNGQTYHIGEIVDNSGDEINYIPDEPSLAELNYLAQRLDEMTDDDQLLFRACVRMEDALPDMKKLINLTYNLKDCVIAGAVSNDAALGKFLVDNDMIDSLVGLPNEDREYIDYGRVGKIHREAKHGVFIDGAYVANLASKFQEVYDGKNLPEQPAETFGVFRLLLQKGSLEPENEKSTWLSLPAKQEDINSVLKELKATSLDDCVIVHSESSIPHFENQFSPDADIDKIVVLTDRISQLKDRALLPKYKAVLDYADCTDLDLAIDLTANLDCYDFFPDISSAEDYGRQLFIKRYNIKPDDPDIKFIRFDRYGFEDMMSDGSKNTDYGFVHRNVLPFIQEYVKFDPTHQQLGTNMT